MRPEDFWSSSPRETESVIRAAIARHRDSLGLAWMSEALRRTERLPPLSTFLGDDQGRGPQAADEQQLNADLFAAGGVGQRGRLSAEEMIEIFGELPAEFSAAGGEAAPA